MAAPASAWDHDADPNTPAVTRWSSLHQIIEGVVGEHEGMIDFGVGLFPSQAATMADDVSACPVNADVEVPVAPMNKAAVLAGIPPAGAELHGATPAAAAVIAARDHLQSLDPAAARAIVLVTDSAANWPRRRPCSRTTTRACIPWSPTPSPRTTSRPSSSA